MFISRNIQKSWDSIKSVKRSMVKIGMLLKFTKTMYVFLKSFLKIKPTSLILKKQELFKTEKEKL